MNWKSVCEEWPYCNDEIWVRFTTDGLNYQEKIMRERELIGLVSVGTPEWRELEAPEWMSTEQKDKFDSLKGMNWSDRVRQISLEDHG